VTADLIPTRSTMTSHHPHAGVRRRRVRLLVPAVAVLLALAAMTPVIAQDAEGPALDQTIERDQPVVTGQAVLGDGHIDIGPRFVDGAFTLLVHDDAVIPSVWRTLEDSVLHVGDGALQTVPADPTYAFLGVEPGRDVHVLPQVQRPGVVWVGWNTQDPEVMERIQRGATLTLLRVDGPGELIMYLQSGALGDPEVLWQSTQPERQPIWVEVNTHTHANWVFTEPGVYLVEVEISADLVSGEAVSDVRTLRFSIGDATEPTEAFGVELAAAPREPTPAAEAAAAPEPDDPSAGTGGPVLLWVLAAAVVVLAGGAVAVVARGEGARRRADRERPAEPSGGWS
jgi:surface-anchored protein